MVVQAPANQWDDYLRPSTQFDSSDHAATTPVCSAHGLAQVRIRQTAATEKLLATPNYSYEKRQRELQKKRKAEEKRQKKSVRSEGGDEPAVPAEDSSGDAPPVQPPAGS
jgi:hypothetical protein